MARQSQTPGNEPKEQAGPSDWGRSLTGRGKEKSHCLLYLVLTGLTAGPLCPVFTLRAEHQMKSV